MAIVKWFLNYLKKYKNNIMKSTFFMILESIVELIIPILLACLINKGIANNDKSYITIVSIILFVLIILGLLGSIFNSYYSSHVAANISFDLRKNLFSSICDRTYKDLDNVNISKSITIFTDDITTISTVILYSIRLFFKTIFIFIFSVFLSYTISSRLFIIILVVVPICLFIFILLFKLAFPYFDLTQESLDDLNQVVRENISGIKVVKTMRQELKEIKKFKKVNNILKQVNIKAMKLVSLSGPILQIFIYFATFVIILYSNRLLKNNLIELGNIMAFLQYLTMILSSLLSGAMILLLVLKSWVSLKRIYNLIYYEVEEVNRINKITNIDSIKIRKLSFRYGNDTKKVLDNISFDIKKGEKIAIVGRCGSGKSTLLKLISNLYCTSDGDILINEKDINTYKEDLIRKNILYVNQNSNLFSGTILSNIKFYSSHKDYENILEISDVSDIVKRKEKGVLSKVESFGLNFSGGEKNRIVLARALFKEVQVLLLDDTLNAVDFKTEKRIWKNIKDNYPDLTIIEVNSRLSNLEEMDKIILLEDGKIEAIGTLKEVSNNKLFKSFYELQKENR